MAVRARLVGAPADHGDGFDLDYKNLKTFFGAERTDLVLFSQDIFYPDILDHDQIRTAKEKIMEIFSKLAAKFSIYLSPGTIIEVEDGSLYRTGLLFDPGGKLILKQRQLFLSRNDKKKGIDRGIEVKLEYTELGKVGFMIGSDCWYPEVGRFLVLEGVDIVLAPTRLQCLNRWKQLAGVWSQVQQNQFFALEAVTGGLNLIHGPCEITPFRTGIISPSGTSGEALLNTPDQYLNILEKRVKKTNGAHLIEGEFELERLFKIRSDYPLKSFLNPRLYQKSGLMIRGR